MKNIFNSSISLLILIYTILLSTNLYSIEKSKNTFSSVSDFHLPKKLTWCGETVPLDDPLIRERAEREFYLLLQQPGQIMLYLKRSGRYFPMYEKILDEEGLPSDLKYLSVAESALYMSRSSAGALGLWQFIKSTGKRYGLRISKWVDERKHPEKSTRAAGQYLKKLKREFGKWTLAAAAYNMGENGLRSNLKFQNEDEYFDLHLNSETSRYIFRIIAIRYLLENHEKFGILLNKENYYKAYKSKTITVGTRIRDLSKWAKSYNTSYSKIKLLNPWILRRELRPPLSKKPYKIKIPVGW
jgi:peptidoglycan lytic transglycosylase D